MIYDEQQYNIKHLKEQYDIDDEHEVQEIPAARISINQNKAVYLTCNQTFAMINWLKNISKKGTPSSGAIIVAKYAEIVKK